MQGLAKGNSFIYKITDKDQTVKNIKKYRTNQVT